MFSVVHKWGKDYVKYSGHGVEPVHIFFQVVEGQVNLIWWKVVYNTILKTLLDHCKDPKNSSFALTYRNISSKYNGTTIHSGLGIKPGKKVRGLNDKFKPALKNRLSEMKSLIIN